MKKEKPSFQYSICLIIFWWNKKRVGGGDLKEKNYMNLYLLIFIKEDRQADAWECTWWLVCKLYIILNFAHWYSQTLNKLFIINAGSGFRMVWKVIKTFLDARTISKIQVRTFLVNSFLGRGSLLLLVVLKIAVVTFTMWCFRCLDTIMVVNCVKLLIQGKMSVLTYMYLKN